MANKINYPAKQASILLRGILRSPASVIGGGTSLWDGKSFPVAILQDLSDIHDLPDMIRIMCQLPVNGVHHAKRVISDRYHFQKIARLQAVKRI